MVCASFLQKLVEQRVKAMMNKDENEQIEKEEGSSS